MDGDAHKTAEMMDVQVTMMTDQQLMMMMMEKMELDGHTSVAAALAAPFQHTTSSSILDPASSSQETHSTYGH